ncbi:efflux RND transporter permease subunit [Microvirga aerilata]|uniref:Efflux RND transporter permease subunit n=1 Tax=Microvirga aerilata TaxID=670292 RepID=A0A937CX64_9HYPH|nr:efflux RND transporter permease subunit [Microvirga aerilata]
MISKFFIDRPIFASVLSITIVLVGLIAMRILPVAQYPEIVPPQVVVSATYPGASAQTTVETVAAPLEQQVNGVEGMLYMQSTSTGFGSQNYSTVATSTGPRPCPSGEPPLGGGVPAVARGPAARVRPLQQLHHGAAQRTSHHHTHGGSGRGRPV